MEWLIIVGVFLASVLASRPDRILDQNVNPFDSDQAVLQLQDDSPIVGSRRRPNFLFILTDDQDSELDSVSYTPLITNLIRDKGTSFANHFVTTAICCPSRVSLWTGLQPHNTNVTDVFPPYGGYPKFVERGFNDAFLPVWLQEAGYGTYYTGKLFNAHTVENYHSPYVNGFNGSEFLLDPYTYSYLNSTYLRNRDTPVSYQGRHTSDVITEKALGLLDEALAGDEAFFLGVAPIAPHSNVDTHFEDISALRMTAPIPAKRHEHMFEDVKVPRTESFNPEKPSGVSWIKDLARQNETIVDYGDEFYRARLQSLQAVDEMVESLIARLDESGQLDNTYIIYTSDNGFHIGQHRLPPGKTCGFEEDIRVPFFIRGPGIPQGKTESAVSTHIDVVPTLFRLAGIPLRSEFDGTAMPVADGISNQRHEHVAVEYWGSATAEGIYGDIGPGGSLMIPNNTYKAVRVLGQGYNLYYSVWCNNEHELYDLETDPSQMHNLLGAGWQLAEDESILLERPLSAVVARLDALLMVLKSCRGGTCIKPWAQIHRDEPVESLADALHERWDSFYLGQPRVLFDWCDAGYLVEAEGPQTLNLERHGLPWDAWT